MRTLARLERWKAEGVITGGQFDLIAPLVRKDRFSVFLELNVLLYLGVLSFIAGVGWTIQTYFASLGDAAIISALTLLLGLSFYYCSSRALPYSREQVGSPNMAFDYVLYGACLAYGVEVGYIESRFHLLQNYWDVYLLISSLLLFALAYRFDNRLVLSLALSTLAGWFGLRISRFGLGYGESLRPYALAYGALISGIGLSLHWLRIKQHFLETYLHIAANMIFIALVSGVSEADVAWLYLAGLLIAGTVAVIQGVRRNRFVFVAYGTVYSYIGVSIEILRRTRIDTPFALSYLIVSSALIIVSMIVLARRFGREE